MAWPLWGKKIILGLDLKNGLVATHGWKETVPMSAVQALESFEGLVRQAIVTEVSRDGMLQGVNLEFYAGASATVPGRGDHRERGRVQLRGSGGIGEVRASLGHCRKSYL